MAETNTPAVQTEEHKGCPGDCKLCVNEQRLYCAARIGFQTMNMVDELRHKNAELCAAVSELTQIVAELKNKSEESMPADPLVSAPIPEDTAPAPKKGSRKSKK